MKKNESLNVEFPNIKGFKVGMLNIADQYFDVLALNETRLDNSILSQDMFTQNNNLIRADPEEVGSPSQHALQLINIQSRDFLQCLLEKLWKFISFFRQEYLIFLKVSFYRCFKYESNLTTFALFGILMTLYLC